MPEPGSQGSQPHDETRAAESATSGGLTEQPGTVIDRYELIERIGEGGFGVVYRAKQHEPVQREVALKIIKLGMDTQDVIQRFTAERQALALMDHPNIAQVLDAGATSTGRPYFVMELVRGAPVTQYCDEQSMSLQERLELFTSICEAVQHAHQKGVIHRDLKPSNILVAKVGSQHVVKVIDFGIAKATQQRLTEETMQTRLGQFLGTPAYMSPEQTDPHSLDIDTRSDIYALGVILYEMLSGSTPFDMASIQTNALEEIRRVIREEEPTRPSTRLSQIGASIEEVARQRQITPTQLREALRGDLDWIILKTLEKDRTRRYETATSLAEDVHRYLRNEPVHASPPSRRYRLSKFIRRNRAGVATALLFSAALVLGLIGTSYGLRQALFERDRAKDAELRANNAADEARKAAEAERVASEAALKAEKEARKSSEEVKQIAQFQASILNDLDARSLGVDIFRDLKSRAGDQLGDDAEAFLTRLEQLNPTDVAAGLIDRNFLDRAVNLVGHRFKEQPSVRGQIQFTVSQRYTELGLYEKAMETMKLCLESTKEAFGADDENTLICYNELAGMLRGLGRLAEAEVYQQRVVAGLRGKLAPDDPTLLSAISNLGTLLDAMEKYDESRVFLNEARKGRMKRLGPEHPDTLNSMNNYALSLRRIDRDAEAEALFREVIAVRKRILGPHPFTINTILNLANVVRDRGGYEEATTLYDEALQMSREVFGEDHPDTAYAHYQRSRVPYFEGRYEDAIPILEQAVATYRKTIGPDHPRTVGAVGNLGKTQLLAGRFEPAEENLRFALTGYLAKDGPTHPNTLAVRVDLATLLRKTQRFEACEEELQTFERDAEATLEANHGARLRARTQRGHLASDQGRWTEAEAIFLAIETDAPEEARKLARENIVEFYEAWDASAPGEGHAAKAEPFRALLQEAEE